MRKHVAKALVLVALCSAAVPAFAGVLGAGKVLDGGCSSSGKLAVRQNSAKNYWTASSEYYVSRSGATAVSDEAPRHVLISGWHPVEGFETEIAQEAANSAEHSGR